jgi:uncharacterized membrane protein YadS
MRVCMVLLAAVALSGCYRVSYESRLPAGGKRHEQVLPYYVLGLVGRHAIDLDELCPEGVHAWHTEATALGLLDLVTLGIYTPRTLVVECAPGGAR